MEIKIMSQTDIFTEALFRIAACKITATTQLRWVLKENMVCVSHFKQQQQRKTLYVTYTEMKAFRESLML